VAAELKTYLYIVLVRPLGPNSDASSSSSSSSSSDARVVAARSSRLHVSSLTRSKIVGVECKLSLCSKVTNYIDYS
jgi:hypothetical protein